MMRHQQLEDPKRALPRPMGPTWGNTPKGLINAWLDPHMNQTDSAILCSCLACLYYQLQLKDVQIATGRASKPSIVLCSAFPSPQKFYQEQCHKHQGWPEKCYNIIMMSTKNDMFLIILWYFFNTIFDTKKHHKKSC